MQAANGLQLSDGPAKFLDLQETFKIYRGFLAYTFPPENTKGRMPSPSRFTAMHHSFHKIENPVEGDPLPVYCCHCMIAWKNCHNEAVDGAPMERPVAYFGCFELCFGRNAFDTLGGVFVGILSRRGSVSCIVLS